MERSMKRILKASAFTIIISSILGCATMSTTTDEPRVQQLLVDEARIVVDTFAAIPEMGWFRKYLKDAEGILIVPIDKMVM